MTSFSKLLQCLDLNIDFLNILYIYGYTYLQCVLSSNPVQSFLYYNLIIIISRHFLHRIQYKEQKCLTYNKNIKHTKLRTSLK